MTVDETLNDKLIHWRNKARPGFTLPLEMAEVDALLAVFESLDWIAMESAQYADGAPDATPAARFLTIVEQTARSARNAKA